MFTLTEMCFLIIFWIHILVLYKEEITNLLKIRMVRMVIRVNVTYMKLTTMSRVQMNFS